MSEARRFSSRRPAVRVGLLVLLAPGGCAREGAPSFIVAGSYFPAWMACAFAGVGLALVLRILFGRFGLDRTIAFRLTFYSAVAVAFAAMFWLYGFGN